MLPVLEEVAGSMLSGPSSSDMVGSDTAGSDTAGSMCSGPVSSSTAGTLTTEGAGDDIGEGLGAVKTHQNVFPLHAAAHPQSTDCG